MNQLIHFKSIYHCLLVSALVLTQWGTPIEVCAQTRYSKGLGRLLTSERERMRVDDARFNILAPQTVAEVKAQVQEAPPLLRIEGITNRPDRPIGQRTTIWINGRSYTETELPKGLTFVRNSAGEITGINSVLAKGKTEFAKIGDDIARPQTAEEARAIEMAEIAAKKATTETTKP